jgi:hypothetical protein
MAQSQSDCRDAVRFGVDEDEYGTLEHLREMNAVDENGYVEGWNDRSAEDENDLAVTSVDVVKVDAQVPEVAEDAALDGTDVDVAGLVAPLEVPSTPRTGDVDGLLDPFPAGDMGLGGREWSGSSFTGSEMTDDQDDNFYKDSKGRRPDQVFALASVPLEEVAQEQAARAERKKQARVAEGRLEDDSAGDESSEDESSEDESSEDDMNEDSEDEGSEYESWHHTGSIDAPSEEDRDLAFFNKEMPDESFGADEEAGAGAAKRPRTDGN